MSSWDNANRYGAGQRGGDDNTYGRGGNYDNNQYGGRERYTGGNRGGYDRDNYNTRANDYDRDNGGGRTYGNDRDNYGSRGGNYGGRDYDTYGSSRGGNHGGNYGGYDRDNDSNRQLANRSQYNNYSDNDNDGDWGFGQISRKMRDLERNFIGGTFGSNDTNRHNTSMVPFGGGGMGGLGGFGADNQLQSMLGRNSATPSVVDENGSKQLQWRFNAAGFNPDEVRVSTTGNNQLEVHARHEDRGKHHAQVREFTRIVQLPEGVNAQDVKTRINNQGLLTINVPYTGNALEYQKGRELPLTQGGSTSNSRGTTGSSYGNAAGTTGATGQHSTTGQHNTNTGGTTGTHQNTTGGNTTGRNNQ